MEGSGVKACLTNKCSEADPCQPVKHMPCLSRGGIYTCQNVIFCCSEKCPGLIGVAIIEGTEAEVLYLFPVCLVHHVAACQGRAGPRPTELFVVRALLLSVSRRREQSVEVQCLAVLRVVLVIIHNI